MKNEHLKNFFIILFSFLEILATNVPKKLRQTNLLNSSGVVPDSDSAEDFHCKDAHFKDTPQVGFGQTWERTVHHGLASSDPENSRRKTLGKFQT